MKRHCEFTSGSTFKNANGKTYHVMHSTTNDKTTVVSGGRFPWVCVAHDISELDDGTFEWAYSDQVGFLTDIQRKVEDWCEANGIDIIGGLSLYIAPWWEEGEDEDPGIVIFIDHAGTMFATDGNRFDAL